MASVGAATPLVGITLSATRRMMESRHSSGSAPVFSAAMRVLFSLLDANVGGGQRVAIQVASRLVEEDHEIGLLVPDEGPASEEFRGLGAAVHRADLRTLRRTDGVGPAAGLARSFDLLLLAHLGAGRDPRGAVARRAGIVHVVHRHTDPHFSPRAFTRLAQRRLHRHAYTRRPSLRSRPTSRLRSSDWVSSVVRSPSSRTASTSRSSASVLTPPKCDSRGPASAS